MTGWSKLDDKIHRPDTKGVEYRDTHSTVFADNKLWFFGKRGVDAKGNDSMSWHESCMLDGFVSVFDVNTKKWEFKSYAKVDDTHEHRDHIFTVKNKIFMVIYSVEKNFWKLLTWDNDKWTEVKFDDQCSKECCPSGCKRPILGDADDGLLVACGNCLCKLEINVDHGQVKGAKCVKLGTVDLAGVGPCGSVAHMASSKDKIVVWYGQEMCGFWWQPERPLTGDLKPGASAIQFEKNQIGEPHPSYHYNGPRDLVVTGNNAIMLGGSQQIGLGHTKDNLEIWVYDMASKTYRKSSATMPGDAPGYRFTVAFDRDSGNVYLCDLETGIYTINVKELL